MGFNPLSLLKPVVKRVTSLLPDSGHEKGRHKRDLTLAEAQAGGVASMWRPSHMLFILFILVWNHGIYEFIVMWRNGAFHQIVLPENVWVYLGVIASLYVPSRTFEKIKRDNQAIGAPIEPQELNIAPSPIPKPTTPTKYRCNCGTLIEAKDGQKTPCPKCGVWFE